MGDVLFVWTAVTLAAHFNEQTCLKHVKELFLRTGNKKRPSTTNSLKQAPNLKPRDITSRTKPEMNEW